MGHIEVYIDFSGEENILYAAEFGMYIFGRTRAVHGPIMTDGPGDRPRYCHDVCRKSSFTFPSQLWNRPVD